MDGLITYSGGVMFKKQGPLLILICSLSFTSVYAQDNTDSSSYITTPPNQNLMLTPASKTSKTSKSYILPATNQTSQWGVFDTSQPPVLKIMPGDTVAIETMAASDNQVVPGTSIEEIIKIQTAVPNRGPHQVTGPIYVEGAEPGDVLKIHFNKITPRAYASNNTGPGKGLFPDQFKQLYVKYFYLDVKNKKMQFAPGITVPLGPFPGVVAVAPEKPGKYDSAPPGPFGGNMDLREMTEGSTLYLPVFQKGALLWTGDSHAGQGNGEIDLTAIETAFEEINVTVDLIKQKHLDWPRVETATDWIAVGYDQDINKALDILKQETIKLAMEAYKLSKTDAEKKMYANWNCPIAEVVNGVKGVYCMLPKQQTSDHYQLLKSDNSEFYTTYAKDNDLQKAMSSASMEMLNKVVAEKKLSRDDAYTLLSIAMDCRIAPYQSGEKEVHCTLAKNLWNS